MRILTLLFSLLLLASCGGGGDDPALTPLTPSTTPTGSAPMVRAVEAYDASGNRATIMETKGSFGFMFRTQTKT